MTRFRKPVLELLALVLAIGCYFEAGAVLDRPEPARYDPLNASPKAKADCDRVGKEYVAWRGDDRPDWIHSCVDAKLGLHEAGPR